MPPADPDSERTLRVSGTGVAESDADRCVLQVRLRSRVEATGDALTQLSQLATAVLAALDEQGISREAIRTTDVAVADRWDERHNRVIGRMATYGMRIVIAELDQAGAVVSRLAAVAGDSLDVQGFELSLGNPEALLGDARRLAVLDAQTKAGELAAAAGVTLGDLLSIEEEPTRGEKPRRAAFAAALVRPGEPIPPMPVEGGPLSVTSAVTLVYRIS
jgi:uncharacterized protein